MNEAKTVLYPDSNGKLPDYNSESCFQRLYSKLLIKLIGKRTIIANATINWTSGQSTIKDVDSGLFFNSDFPSNLIITQRLND